MSEVVSCPECQRRLAVPAELLGRSVRCPSCGATFPAQPASSAAPVSPAPQPPEMPTVDYMPPQDDLESRMRRDMMPHRGIMVLVFGILSVAFVFPSLCCLFSAFGGLGFGITAWILGQNDLRSMAGHRMDPDGMGLTRAGWICGIIGTVLSVLSILLHIGMFVIMMISDTH